MNDICICISGKRILMRAPTSRLSLLPMKSLRATASLSNTAARCRRHCGPPYAAEQLSAFIRLCGLRSSEIGSAEAVCKPRLTVGEAECDTRGRNGNVTSGASIRGSTLDMPLPSLRRWRSGSSAEERVRQPSVDGDEMTRGAARVRAR